MYYFTKTLRKISRCIISAILVFVMAGAVEISDGLSAASNSKLNLVSSTVPGGLDLVFNSIGIGTMYMGMCLNTVSQAWKPGINSFILLDLGMAAYCYNDNDKFNGGYGTQYWEDVMYDAFGDSGKWKERGESPRKDKRYENGVDNITKNIVATKGKYYKLVKEIP